MTHPMDYLSHPRPESGQHAHTQESGDDGLSSNMEHKFSDYYTEHALPVAATGSFVKPIPKGDFFNSENPRKIWSHPSVRGQVESYAVPVWEGSLKLLKPQLESKDVPPRVTPVALSENIREEITVKAFPAKTAITAGKPDVEIGGEGGSSTDTKMNTGGNKAKPKVPPLAPRNTRNPQRKRSAGRNRKLYLLCLMAVIVHVSKGSPEKCFTCMDEAKCPKLWAIIDSDEVFVFRGHLSHTFPGCAEISPPAPPKKCAVCHGKFNFTITCSEDVGTLQVEDSVGGQIENISSVSCVEALGAPQLPPSNHVLVGLITSVVIFSTVVAALVIYTCRQRRRTDNDQV